MNCCRHIATSLSLDPDDFGYAPFLVAPTCSAKPRLSWKLGEGGDKRLAILDDLHQALAA